MSALLGASGWLLAVAELGAATLIRIRLARHTEAVDRACHELRGPLTAVRLGLELGARIRQLPHSRLRAIELELGRATLALDDLATARARRRSGEVEPVDVGELVADSVEAWRAVAAVKGARLRVVGPRQTLRITGERLRLAQAVGNLIGNAIEHGEGDVRIGVRSRGGSIRIEVVDDGRGLPAPIDELIRRRRRRRAGPAEHGHGLAIVSAIAAAHGGRLAADPRERGACLVLELPACHTRGVHEILRP